MAFADLGSAELELIQPKEGESIWADFLRTHGEGIHPIRFNVDEVAPVIEYLGQNGIAPASMARGCAPARTGSILAQKTRWVLSSKS